MYYGALYVAEAAHLELAALHMLGAAAGVLILAGLWTPIAGAVAGGVEAWIAWSQPGEMPVALILAVLGASLAMIGPGAWSLDARLFGRKQIDANL